MKGAIELTAREDRQNETVRVTPVRGSGIKKREQGTGSGKRNAIASISGDGRDVGFERSGQDRLGITTQPRAYQSGSGGDERFFLELGKWQGGRIEEPD